MCLHRDCNANADAGKSTPPFLLPTHKLHFSHYSLYTSFQVTRCMWLLPIHCLCILSLVLLLVAIPRSICVQRTMFPTLKTCIAKVPCAFLTCINFETGSMLPDISGIVESSKANRYSTNASFLFRRFILNSCCSCHGKFLFSTP
jgi:hypothetical protein